MAEPRSTGARPFLSILLLLAAPVAVPAQVVVNEVLYDPEGPDTGHEFVELRNCGDEGVLLTGWTVETGNGAAPGDWTVEWIGGDFDYLPAGGFFVIGESDVVPPPDYVTALDLQNGPDGVRLTDGGSVVDVVGWGEPLFAEYYEGRPAVDVQSGSSLARTPDCRDMDDNAADFLACPAPTPGAPNVPRVDLAVAARHHGAVVLDAGSPVLLTCLVRNVGSLEVDPYAPVVRLFLDGSDLPEDTVWVDVELAPRDSAEVTLSCGDPGPGYHVAEVDVASPEDEVATNDRARTSFTVGRPGLLLSVNEIMYSPADGESEWVELVNVTEDTVTVAFWMLGDDGQAYRFPAGGDTATVPPGSYLLVAREAGGVPDAVCPVVEAESWEVLSSDDVVVLLDAYGTPVDIVEYASDWGGGKGVSLERVRPDVEADGPNNWGSCVAPAGATPGSANSIYVEVVPAEGRLVAAPNPFSPDADGRDDRTVITFDVPTPQATARLTVFDARGRRRAVLLDHVRIAGTGQLVWDGTDSSGVLLPTGLYVLRLEAINARAGVLVGAKAAVAIVHSRLR